MIELITKLYQAVNLESEIGCTFWSILIFVWQAKFYRLRDASVETFAALDLRWAKWLWRALFSFDFGCELTRDFFHFL